VDEIFESRIQDFDRSGEHLSSLSPARKVLSPVGAAADDSFAPRRGATLRARHRECEPAIEGSSSRLAHVIRPA
jgi:hypothetical protein